MKKLKNLCKCCNKNKLISFMDLGKTPLANSYTKNYLALNIIHDVYYCENCHLVQHNTKIKEKIYFTIINTLVHTHQVCKTFKK